MILTPDDADDAIELAGANVEVYPNDRTANHTLLLLELHQAHAAGGVASAQRVLWCGGLGGTVRHMANDGVPECPNESCDGHLHREFRSGLNQSTSQVMRLGGLALIAGPIVFGAPFFLDYVVRRSAGMFVVVATLVAFIVPIAAGTVILRHRRERMSERTEQQRCNKCGSVFPAAG